jgi:hypothetical protein
MRYFFVILFLLLIPVNVVAHGNSFLEFNPPTLGSFLPNPAQTPYQVLSITNDFLAGFDIWIENTSSAGPATFILYNDNTQEVLTQKVVTVPHIDRVPHGTRFHVDLPSQVSLDPDATYSIAIESALPEFRVYYSTNLVLLQQ